MAACDLSTRAGRVQAAILRSRLAESLWQAKQLDTAACAARRALAVVDRDPRLGEHAARAHGCLGRIASWQGDERQHLAHCRTALARLRAVTGESGIDEPSTDGPTDAGTRAAVSAKALQTALDDLALALHNQREFVDAIVHYRDALAIAERRDDRIDVARITRRLANCCRDAGYLDTAAPLIAACRPSDEATPTDRYNWANTAAMLAERLSETAAADAHYNAVVRLFPFLPRPYGRAIYGLSNAATWFATRGDRVSAARLLRRFRQVAAEEGHPTAQFEIATIEATIAEAEDDLEAALSHWKRSADIARETGQHALLASLAIEQSSVLSWLGRSSEAIDLLRLFAPPPEPFVPPMPLVPVATVLAGLGVEHADGDADEPDAREAADLLERALVAEAGRGMPEIEWRILTAIAEVAGRRGAGDAAILFGKAAVAMIATSYEAPLSGRRAEESLKERLRTHQRLITRLAAAGRLPEASRTQTLMKQEIAHDLMRRSRDFDLRSARVPMRAEEEALLAELHACRQRLRSLGADHEKSRERRLKPARGSNPAPVEGDDGEREATERAQGALRTWLGHALSGHWSTAALGAHPAASATSDKPAPGAGLLRFIPATDGWTAVLTTSKGSFAHRMAGSAADLALQVHAFRSALLRTDPEWQPLAAALFTAIFGSGAARLAGLTQLDIVADGPFAYLPFAALHDGDACLVERLSLSFRTAIASRGRRSDRQGEARVLLLGTAEHDGARLDHVAAEIAAIRARFPAARVPALVTADVLAEELQEGAEIVHIASHFTLEPARADRSCLHLGNGERLTLADLRSPRFDFSAIELLVLSACDTGVADSGVHGPESLAALAQMKGARNVVATLWPVADASAAALMSALYAKFAAANPDLAPSLADVLRAAQLTTRSTADGRAAGVSAQRGFGRTAAGPWAHPFHWAGYVHFKSES
ncbi:MAG: CHAT domain-containing protein [Hyphomicrobium sp.]